MKTTARIMEVDGVPAAVEQIAPLVLANYGHSTAMQVRDGRVRGLTMHLSRLAEATRELFDTALDPDLVRWYVRGALARNGMDASVTVYIFEGHRSSPSVLVSMGPPSDVSGVPQRLRSAVYQRPVPHLKHLGTFGKLHVRRRAEREGFDSVLLVTTGGLVAEAATSNIAFHDGSVIVWPQAPLLPGITMRLIEPRLNGHGLASVHRPVRLTEVPAFRAAFVMNSRGIAAVCRIDDTHFRTGGELMQTLQRAYASVPWDTI